MCIARDVLQIKTLPKAACDGKPDNGEEFVAGKAVLYSVKAVQTSES